MASSQIIEHTRVRLSKDDVETLERNNLLAVSHPRWDGVIVLTLAGSGHHLSHQENGIVQDAALTGGMMDRLKQGELLRFGSKLSVALYPDAVPAPETDQAAGDLQELAESQ